MNKSIQFDLTTIAAHLEGLEDTIIYKLIDRAQYAQNAVVYEPGKSGFAGNTGESLFGIRLRMHEEMDAQFGRFAVPEERPFNSGLPKARRIVNLPETGFAISEYDLINLSREISTSYHALVKTICKSGTDGQYGSSVEHDVYALQSIARRIHYGSLYVAESKYRGDPVEYRKLITARDTAALLSRLTRAEVEQKIIKRIRDKVASIQEQVNKNVRTLVDPEMIVEYYRDTIIPLTKEGEIRYLLARGEGNQ